jgi:predicted AAA+ superfamily ATPase
MKRDISPVLREMLRDASKREVILVEGARQVGKSTLVKQVLDEFDENYVAIDLEKDRKIARLIDKTVDFQDFRALMTDQCGLHENGTILFIDEAQESPVLARYIKSFKEDWTGVRVILTGSSMHRLFNTDVRMPVGRTRSLCVFPFSFSEFLRCSGEVELADLVRSAPDGVVASRHVLLLERYNRYLHVGGLPEVVKAFAAGDEFSSVVDEIMGMLQDDFARKEDYDPTLFEQTIRAVANHVGNPSKYTHIDATKYYAKKVLADLCAWHLVLEVQAQSLDPQHTDFLPKRYLHDLGVVSRFRSMAVPPISLLETMDPSLRAPLGGLFENAVLLSLFEGASAKMRIGTWRKRTASSTEVDFVLDAATLGLKIPIECKAVLQIKRRHAESVCAYLRETHQTFGVLVSAAPFGWVPAGENLRILNVPIYLATRQNLLAYAERLGD